MTFINRVYKDLEYRFKPIKSNLEPNEKIYKESGADFVD